MTHVYLISIRCEINARENDFEERLTAHSHYQVITPYEVVKNKCQVRYRKKRNVKAVTLIKQQVYTNVGNWRLTAWNWLTPQWSSCTVILHLWKILINSLVVGLPACLYDKDKIADILKGTTSLTHNSFNAWDCRWELVLWYTIITCLLK